MIANCPTCGTHYKHEPPKLSVRARCGRCDAALNLTRLSPYRIVTATARSFEPAGCAASHRSIGLDHPGLAATIAHNAARPVRVLPSVRPPDIWEDEDPLPQIPEVTLRGTLESLVPAAVDDVILGGGASEASGREARCDATPGAASPADGGAATLALCLATGAIAGTGASWTIGDTTMTGMAAGATLGFLVGWGWLRWESSK